MALSLKIKLKDSEFEGCTNQIVKTMNVADRSREDLLSTLIEALYSFPSLVGFSIKEISEAIHNYNSAEVEEDIVGSIDEHEELFNKSTSRLDKERKIKEFVNDEAEVKKFIEKISTADMDIKRFVFFCYLSKLGEV